MNFSPKAVTMPTIHPMIKLPKKSLKKIQMPQNRPRIPRELVGSAFAFCADSKMTMAMASLRMDSPKMMV